MSTQTRAIYRDGKLYMDDSLPFPNSTPVVVIIEDASTDTISTTVRAKVHTVLVQAELMKRGPVPTRTASTLSPERAAELSDLFAQGGPLSDIIHEERDEN